MHFQMSAAAQLGGAVAWLQILTAELLAYNADLRVMGYLKASFEWQADGDITGEAALAVEEGMHLLSA